MSLMPFLFTESGLMLIAFEVLTVPCHVQLGPNWSLDILPGAAIARVFSCVDESAPVQGLARRASTGKGLGTLGASPLDVDVAELVAAADEVGELPVALLPLEQAESTTAAARATVPIWRARDMLRWLLVRLG
jgi:hypothetical protein